MSRISPRTLILAVLFLPGMIFMTNCGQDAGNTAPPPATVSMFPRSANVFVNEKVQFGAYSAGASFTWSVNGAVGGDNTVGTITSGGLYTAPAVPPSGSVTVEATSTADASVRGTAAVTVTNPLPVVTSVSPATILVGSGDTVITILGSHFLPSTSVTLGTQNLVVTYWSSTQLTAVVPSALLAASSASTISVSTPSPGGGSDNSAILSVMAAGVVTATNHPLVAKYSISLPRDGEVTVEFGPDANYGRRTWTRPAPAGGGQVDILVAGMRQFSTYHMRATVEFPEGTQFVDVDHSFNTGGLPPERVPQTTVSYPNPGTINGGVELLDLADTSTTSPLIQAAVTDLDGSLIWYYDFPISPYGIPFPIRQLPDGNMLLNLSPGPGGPVTPGIVREVDLEGNTVWEISGDEVNARLATAGFNLQLDAIHHDVIKLPNGHVILLVYSTRTFTDLPGYPGDTVVVGDQVVDLDTNLNPVWVWDSFDHMDVNRHPMAFPDWTHGNALAYSPDDGNLLVSFRHQHWVIKIDYRDGQGTGDILWRLGYQGDFTMLNAGPEGWNYGQHFPIIVSPNSTGVFDLSLFDNGNNRVLDTNGTICGTTGNPPCYSRAPIFQIDEVNKTVQLLFDGKLPAFSAAIGSVSVFGNGNVEADMGFLYPAPIRVVEMTQEASPKILWELDISGQRAYRAYRIPSLYPGVQW
ncbi:MAG: aryl-sulfate sulfotransferase [Terriglobia bacterium]